MAKRITATRKIPPRHLSATLRLRDHDPHSDDSAADEADTPEDRTVDVVFTTGERVLRVDFFEGEFFEELSLEPGDVRLDRLNDGAPLLDSHNAFTNDGVIGVVERAEIKDGEGLATVRFARAEDDAHADAIFRKVRDGIIQNVSVGYRVHRFERTEQEGAAPVLRAVDWEPFEISMVPIGADSGATTRAEDAQPNPCEFVRDEPTEERSPMKDKPQNPKAAVTLEATLESTVDNVEEIRTEAAKLERARIAGIQQIAGALNVPADFARSHIDSGSALEVVRVAAIDAHAQRETPIAEPGGRVEAVPGGDSRDKWLRGAENWLIVRSGHAALLEQYAKQRGEKIDLDPGEFRGLSLLELAREALTRQGAKARGLSKLDLVGRAFTLRGGYQTTSDFPVLLENVMHKTLLAAYGTTPDTWSRFCAVGSVADFRAHNRYRMGTFGRLSQINEHGEFTNLVLPDGRRETIAADTFGNMVAISRQAIINDDMGSFIRIATMLGRAARLSIEVDVYATLALNGGLGPAMGDTLPLFDAAHANLGAGAALAVAAIDENRVVMASQTDDSGNEILDIRPAVLVVPIGLGGQARVINESEFDTDAVGAGATNNFMEPNRVRGLFRDIVDTPRLAGTRRYLFADPMIAPTLEVVFLDGQQAPFLETQDGWRIDGVEYKVRLDYGVDAVDYRGAVTDAGV